MDVFKETFFGLRDSFMQMPLPTRFISVALTALIGIGLWLVVTGTNQTTAMERLFPTGEELSDQEIRDILGAFSTNRLNEWDVVQNHIYVPTSQRDEYWRAMVSADAIPSNGSIRERVQSESSIFEGMEEKRQKLDIAKQMEIEREILEFKDVLRASVQYHSQDFGFARDRRKSASVVVTPKGSAPLPKPVIKAIEDHVRHSYTMDAKDEVVVIDVNASDSAIADNEDPLLQATGWWETHFRNKAQRLLASYGAVRIEATVTVDPTMDQQTIKSVLDSQPVALQEQNSQTTHESARVEPGGAPGLNPNQFQANGNRAVAIDANPNQTVKSTQKSESISKATGEEFQTKRMASFVPTRVAFSIAIPDKYYREQWAKEYNSANPDSTDPLPPIPIDELAKLETLVSTDIKELILPLLPPGPAGEDKYPLIEVMRYEEQAVAEVEQAPLSDSALTWLADSWQVIALMFLAFAALLVARSVGNGNSASRPEFEEGFGLELPKPPSDTEDEFVEEEQPKLKITGMKVKEDLHELVERNPEAAANVLRNWLDEDAA